MKRTLCSLAAIVVVIPLWQSHPSVAQPAPPTSRLTPSRIQQFSRDLIPSSSQDFFKQGQQNVESEIQRLSRRRSPLNENLLKVNQPVPQPGPQNESMRQNMLHPPAQ